MATILAYPLLFTGGAVTVIGSVIYNYIYSEGVKPTLTPHSMAPLPKNKIYNIEDNTQDKIQDNDFIFDDIKKESIYELIKE